MARLVVMVGLMLAGLVAVFAATPISAADEPQKLVNTGPGNVAIQGYDPVAYFTEGEPVKGRPEHSFFWNDAEWHFANPAHRDMFAANPERYAPQFGGFCSMALSNGAIVAADPDMWTIVDGKLYLKVTEQGRDRFRQDAETYIEKAEKHWDELQDQN